MKSSHIPIVALACITVAAAIPAHAQNNGVVNETVQNAVITGNGNSVNQSSNTSVRSYNRGRNTTNGTAIRTQQNADVMGDNNTVNQSTRNRVDQRTEPRR